MLSQKKIKQILIDAEKAFSEKPVYEKFNNSGLCFFIENHPSLRSENFEVINKYQKGILGDKFRYHFTFCQYDDQCYPQDDCWHYLELYSLRFERRDWCRVELKRRFDITI